MYIRYLSIYESPSYVKALTICITKEERNVDGLKTYTACLCYVQVWYHMYNVGYNGIVYSVWIRTKT